MEFASKIIEALKNEVMFMSQGFRRSVFPGAAVIAFVLCVLAASPAIAAQADWKKEWDNTLEAAKKEGQEIGRASCRERV